MENMKSEIYKMQKYNTKLQSSDLTPEQKKIYEYKLQQHYNNVLNGGNITNTEIKKKLEELSKENDDDKREESLLNLKNKMQNMSAKKKNKFVTNTIKFIGDGKKNQNEIADYIKQNSSIQEEKQQEKKQENEMQNTSMQQNNINSFIEQQKKIVRDTIDALQSEGSLSDNDDVISGVNNLKNNYKSLSGKYGEVVKKYSEELPVAIEGTKHIVDEITKHQGTHKTTDGHKKHTELLGEIEKLLNLNKMVEKYDKQLQSTDEKVQQIMSSTQKGGKK